MRVQHKAMLLRELHSALHDRQVCICAADVEFPDRDVCVLFQPLFEVVDDRLVVEPGGAFAVLPIGPQLGNDQVGRLPTVIAGYPTVPPFTDQFTK
jgi:hypothetical protein